MDPEQVPDVEFFFEVEMILTSYKINQRTYNKSTTWTASHVSFFLDDLDFSVSTAMLLLSWSFRKARQTDKCDRLIRTSVSSKWSSIVSKHSCKIKP